MHEFQAPSDAALRRALALATHRTAKRLASAPGDADFIAAMQGKPIAEHAERANAQLYELPTDFFRACFGPRLKFSCCLFDDGVTLAEAEARALAETAEHADLRGGRRILDLGCGWGALSLWLAERFPDARIVAVSKSPGQRAFIESAAHTNVEVWTADLNALDTDERFDRIVAIEVFEHMTNWRALLEKCRTWLKPDGRLFVHHFAHATTPYRFDVSDDWIARNFFAGGIMPSRALLSGFDDLFQIEETWFWSGKHYERTALGWLTNFDSRLEIVRPILQAAHGADAALWEHRWRLFFLSMATLFGHAGGDVWGVVHARLKPR